ncbi:MAG: hypothetical protein M1817_006432 [Caeruleum heppii]|nr:MAG: hypothetical protein M1817_006432 [Caeruleum heppii]
MPQPPSTPWTAKPKVTKTPEDAFPHLASPERGIGAAASPEYQARQEDEVEALRSIYMDDFEDMTSAIGPWKRNAEHVFKLRLTAYSDPETTLTLCVTMTATYPKSLPILTLEGTSNFREAERKTLAWAVEDLPKTLLGSEMIYDVASPIRDILEDIVQARAGQEKLPSLEEERAIQQAAEREEQEARQVELQLKSKAATAEEERMLEQMVQDELERQKERARGNRNKGQDDGVFDVDEDDAAQDDSDCIVFDRPIKIEDDESNLLSFRRVLGKTMICQGPITRVFVVRPAKVGSAPSPPTLVLKEATLSGNVAKSDIVDLEADLELLKKMRQVANSYMLQVLDFKVDISHLDHDTWTISILTEWANKGSVQDLLHMVGPLNVDSVRAWCVQLLEALECYHCNGVVHGNLHPGNILLNRSKTGNTSVKLADAGYQQRLHRLQQQDDETGHATARSTYWIAPEAVQAGSNLVTRKTDVWDLGVVIIQMLFGHDVLEKHTSPEALIESTDLSKPLEDFIRKLCRSDPKKRPNAFDMLANEFLRSNAPVLVQPASPVHSRSMSSASLMPLRPTQSQSDSAMLGGATSRYAMEFHELERLGKGGFGEVFKARNKLDSQMYAVKKVVESSRGSLEEIMQEIMHLAKLNHPYVVRYKNAWFEEEFSPYPSTEGSSSAAESSSQSPYTGPSIDYGQSSVGLDIISSTGGPTIEFGYDDSDNESSNCESEADVFSASDHASPRVGAGLGRNNVQIKDARSNSQNQMLVKRTLFIQMEFCERRTLRDLLRQDLSDDIDQGWRLFRQIIQGLDHIHDNGIIHRDLKPENIFIDGSGAPRIGDFGLATSGKYYLADRASASVGHVANDLTRSIGTAMYVAPELRSSWLGNYNEKVDMYSLGITFFEMCYPLKTGMERDQVLRSLREKHHALPTEFHKVEKLVQGQIIESLISHRPSERPSASELLHGGKLPVQMEDETIRLALQGLADSNSAHYQQILSALFSQPVQQIKDFTWDSGSPSNYGYPELLLQGLIKETLTGVFRRHGAVEATRPLLFPRSNYYMSNVVQLLDSSGTLLQLPYDLTLPYARLLAKRSPSAQKSFAFGQVYRDTYTGGHPQSHGEVDFDIISFDTLDMALKEAEVIKVVDEIIDAFPSLKSAQMCFHINHSDLLEAILEFCRISVHQRPRVKEIMSKLNIGLFTWQKIRTELRAPSLEVSSTSLDDLARFDFRESPEKASQTLQSIFEGTEYAEKVAPMLSHLGAVVKYAKKYDVQRKIYVCPLSNFNEKFYQGGVLFQCLYDTKRKEVFAAGGRYDSLIRAHRPKIQQHSDACRAVGFNLGWEKVFASMMRRQKPAGKAYLKKPVEEVRGHWATRRADALVASFDSKALRSAGLEIVRSLWGNDISAELAVDARSTEELMAHHGPDKHCWIILIKQDTGSHGERILKVRSTITKEDSDIRSSELLGWLRSEIRARDHREGTHERAKLLRHQSQPEATQAVMEGEPKVRVLFSQHKGKKNNRRNVIEAAQTRTQELVHSFLDGPVAAIEVKDDVLDAIRDTSLGDPDSWRRVIRSVPAADGKYLSQVHELMCDLAREMKGVTRNSFIYNFRTGACVYYDLGR